MNILSKSSEETHNIGYKIGELLFPGAVIALEGDLGGGKTTFTKGLAKGLGVKDEVTSPSFSLEKMYQLPSTSYQLSGEKKKLIADSRQRAARLYHFDFYRIENPKDMMSYELMEALDDLDGVVVVEWAEKIEKELPKEKLIVRFHYISENEREIELISEEENYKTIISNISH